MHNYKELKIWQRSIDLVTDVYLLTKSFPETERFGITSQIQRSAISIPSNIAEGSGRSSEKEFVRFLDISKASAFELESQLIISNNLDFISESEAINILAKVGEIQKMIYGFIKVIKKNLDS